MLVREIDAYEHKEWLPTRKILWPHHNNKEHINEMESIMRDPACQVLFLKWVIGKLDVLLEFATRSYAEDCHSSTVGHIEGWYVYVDEDMRQHGCSA
mgnify:CR=1 FL=1